MHFRILNWQLLLLLSLLLPIDLVAQSPALTRGPEALATSHTTTCTGLQSMLKNPAGLYNIENTAIKFSATTRFNEVAFTTVDATIAIPTPFTALEISASHFGDDVFAIDRLSIATGHRMGIASLGIRMHSFTYRNEATGSRTILVTEAGGQAELSDKVRMGAWILNPGQARVTETEYFPTAMSLGVALQATDKLLLLLETEKNILTKAVVKAGVRYALNDYLIAMMSVQSEGHRLATGITFEKDHLLFQFGSAWAGTPGFIHQIGINYLIR